MLTEPRPPLSNRHRVVLVLVLAVSLLCSALAIAGHHHDARDNDTHCAFCLAAAHFGGVPTPVMPITTITPDVPLRVIDTDVWHDARPRHHSQPRAPPLA